MGFEQFIRGVVTFLAIGYKNKKNLSAGGSSCEVKGANKCNDKCRDINGLGKTEIELSMVEEKKKTQFRFRYIRTESLYGGGCFFF